MKILILPAIFFGLWIGIHALEPMVNYQLAAFEVLYLIGGFLTAVAIVQSMNQEDKPLPIFVPPLQEVPPEWEAPDNWRELFSEHEETGRLDYNPNQINIGKRYKSVIKRPGFVYLVRSATGLYKIGRTINPDDRMGTFSVKLPFEVEYEHVIPCKDHYSAETILHNTFAAEHVNGEWFQLSKTDVAYIKSIKEL